MNYLRLLAFITLMFLATTGSAESLNTIAREYVNITLAMDKHDPGFVDAYYGPEEIKQAITEHPLSLDAIDSKAEELLGALAATSISQDQPLVVLRHEYLTKQLQALRSRLAMVKGEKFSFDEESRRLFDAVLPAISLSDYDSVLTELEKLIPGKGPLYERIDAFKKDFIVPEDKLEAVMVAAIAACQVKTNEYIELPESENFQLELVKNKPWGGYNWYQGKSQSLIQVNTDLPFQINNALLIGCHEGYPGHHTYNALLEKNLYLDRGWIEYSIYALFSPQSLIAEGSANYGHELAFSKAEQLAFETSTLYPIAGLDASKAADYEHYLKLAGKLKYASNAIARDYLDRKIDKAKAVELLQKYTLVTTEQALQSISFFDYYRSYVINYTLGKDLVKAYVERHAKSQPERWQVFKELLSSPRLPGGLN